MQYVVVGLGNPGEEYENTRHNVGRMVVMRVAQILEATDWRDDKKLRAKHAVAHLGKDTVVLVLPDNYMNRSGGSVGPLIQSAPEAERLVVVHDDIDLPLGSLRIVFDRGAGGHNGVLSIERTLKSRAFVRVRVGLVPTTPGGKLKKPKGGAAVQHFILKPITKKEGERMHEVVERAAQAVVTLLTKGREAAMREFN